MAKRGRPPKERHITAEHILILRHVADGKTNPQISTLMGQGETWAADQLRIIFAVLGVQSRAQAVSVAIGRGLIDPPRFPR